MRRCTVEGCEEPRYKAFRRCRKHLTERARPYHQEHRAELTERAVSRRRERSATSGTKLCECGCGTLIARINHNGKPGRFAPHHQRRVSVEERFLTKIEFPTDSDCWLWTGQIRPNGYGVLGIGKRDKVYAHRLAYELGNGSIPAGMDVHHDCGVRHCVNPDHLETVTRAEHLRLEAERRRSATGSPAA